MNPDAKNQLWIAGDGAPAYYMDLHLVVSTSHDHSSEVTEHAVERGANVVDHIRPRPDEVTMQIYISNSPIDDARMSVEPVELALPTETRELTSLPLKLPENPGPPLLSVGGISNAIGSLVDKIFSSPKVYAASVYGPAQRGSRPVTAMLGRFSQEFDAVQEALAKLEALKANATLLQVYTPKRAYDSMVLTSIKMSRGADDGDGATLSLTFRSIRLVEAKRTRAPASSLAKPQDNKGAQVPAEKVKKASILALMGVSSARGSDLSSAP